MLDSITLDPYPVGSYLTDGDSLWGIVGQLPQDASLRLLEDCRTLEVTVVSVAQLQAHGVQHVAR